MPSRARCSICAGVNVGLVPTLLNGGRGEVRDAAVQLAIRVLVERAAHRIRRVLGDAGHLERFAVVEVRVAAAVAHDHRMISDDTSSRSRMFSARLSAQLGVVEEEALHPRHRAVSAAPSPSACRRCCWMLTNSTSKGLPTRTSFSSTSPPAWL